MDDERFTTPRETSQTASGRSTTTKEHLEYATQRAQVLFGSYRRGDANDPDQYVTSIAAVLTLYDRDLIREVTDPRTGISTTEKFATYMPNSGELKVYCDGIRDRRARIAHLESLPRPGPRMPRLIDDSPGRRAQILVHSDAPQYQQMVERVQGADKADWRNDEEGRGIWVSPGLFYNTPGPAKFKPLPAPSDAELRAHYKPQAEAAE